MAGLEGDHNVALGEGEHIGLEEGHHIVALEEAAAPWGAAAAARAVGSFPTTQPDQSKKDRHVGVLEHRLHHKDRQD